MDETSAVESSSHSHSLTESGPVHSPAQKTSSLQPPTSGYGAPAGPTSTGSGSPFNFQPQELSTGPVRANIGQRRGHRYKHSSVSAQHQIFQEPPQRPPPVLPASLPVPTFSEACDSMSREQRLRLVWCLCHVAVAVFIFFQSHGSLAMMALSHLVFFDAGSAAICVAVDVFGNFEVWKRSSVRHPFGLQRVEVLAGFAMSVVLLFGGFDLVSHGVKHYLSDGHAHDLNHDNDHDHAADVVLACFSAISATLLSAYGLRNHARISRAMRVSYLSALPSLLSNPFHVLTFASSSLLLGLSFVGSNAAHYALLDASICAAIAVAMFALGFRLAVAQGLMLLMSYGGTATGLFLSDNQVPRIVREVEEEPEVTKVEDAQFWQVHYGLGLANLQLRVAKGVDEVALSKLRVRVSNLVQNRLGEGYGQGSSLRWEVTVQTTVDTSLNQ
ncbi:hypothetical protein TD95_000470 [Thielaviopsis punctulata]|uniref:Zinc transporter n=1 Tax=Thielaviopsis punctulata TaxID=72032 RepID=A0A0F4ZB96_9PEZI|nr:hypothetical protein TD95_000470 [Thielaviopsis punctulata]